MKPLRLGAGSRIDSHGVEKDSLPKIIFEDQNDTTQPSQSIELVDGALHVFNDPEGPNRADLGAIPGSGGGGGGQVDSIQPGPGIAVDNTDPVNPEVSAKISADSGNALGLGSDDGLMLDPAGLVSTDSPNDMSVGSDGKLRVVTTMKSRVTILSTLSRVGESVTNGQRDSIRSPVEMSLAYARASVDEPSSSGDIVIDCDVDGLPLFGLNKLVIEEGDTTSKSAQQPDYLLSGFQDDALIVSEVTNAGTGAEGLKIWFVGTEEFVPTMLWTPAHMAVPPAIWLDWDSPVINVSGRASEWVNDKGSLGGSFTQADSLYRPLIVGAELNGKRVLRFSPSRVDVLVGSADTRPVARNQANVYSFAIVKAAAGTGIKKIFNASWGAAPSIDSSVRAAITVFDAEFRAYQRRVDSGSASPLTLGDASGVWRLLSASHGYSAAALGGTFNGTVVGPSATGQGTGNSANTLSNAVEIGGDHRPSVNNQTIDGEIAAIVVCAGAEVNRPTQQRVEGWGAHECGLQTDLPNDHPFRHVPPYVTTPVLQTNLTVAPSVSGFVAATNGGDVGVAQGPAVGTAFGTLLNSEPSLSAGQGITVVFDGSSVGVQIEGISLPSTSMTATLMTHTGAPVAEITITESSGVWSGSAAGLIDAGNVYYVRLS